MPANHCGESTALGSLKTYRRAGIAVLFATLLVGCDHLEADFETIRIRVDGVPLSVEVADDPAERARGLMYRDELPQEGGMLFVYPYAQPLTFWMKNTPLDLDIGFFDATGSLLNVESMTAFDESSRYRSKQAARYALETHRGWFAAHGIRPGARLELPTALAQP